MRENTAPGGANRFFAEVYRTLYGQEREMPEPIIIRIAGVLALIVTWAAMG